MDFLVDTGVVHSVLNTCKRKFSQETVNYVGVDAVLVFAFFSYIFSVNSLIYFLCKELHIYL